MPHKPTGGPVGRPRGFRLSPESKKAISDGMKRAWARRKESAKVEPMTVAARTSG